MNTVNPYSESFLSFIIIMHKQLVFTGLLKSIRLYFLPVWFLSVILLQKIMESLIHDFIILPGMAETDYNVQGRYSGSTDVPLNETGIRQAKELARNSLLLSSM